MSRNHSLGVLCCAAFLLSGAALVRSDDPESQGSPFEFSAKRSAASISDDGGTITIESPTGIGSLEVKRLRPKWPAKLTLRIAVKGLEGLTLRSGNLEIRSFLGAAASEIRQRDAQGTWRDAKPDERHAVSIVRREKYVEIVVPPLLLESGEEKLLVSWVDFYRG